MNSKQQHGWPYELFIWLCTYDVLVSLPPCLINIKCGCTSTCFQTSKFVFISCTFADHDVYFWSRVMIFFAHTEQSTKCFPATCITIFLEIIWATHTTILFCCVAVCRDARTHGDEQSNRKFYPVFVLEKWCIRILFYIYWFKLANINNNLTSSSQIKLTWPPIILYRATNRDMDWVFFQAITTFLVKTMQPIGARSQVVDVRYTKGGDHCESGGNANVMAAREEARRFQIYGPLSSRQVCSNHHEGWSGPGQKAPRNQGKIKYNLENSDGAYSIEPRSRAWAVVGQDAF